MTGTPWRPKTLERLDAAIQACRSDKERRILLVKKACALVRFSLIEQGSSILRDVQSKSDDFDPRLKAWVMFCEGLIEHFAALAEKAKSGFKRAYAVSIASGDIELAAISSAWLAVTEFNAGNLAAVPSALVQSFTYADRNNSAARARACLVVADMYNCAGDPASARAWYQRGRNAAVDDGDIAMQSVGMYNDATNRVWHVVLSDCRRNVDSHQLMLASIAVDSVGNLDLGLGVRRLTSLVPLLRAEVRTVEQKWDEAIGLFEAYLSDRSVEGQNRLMPKLHAQMAYCLAMAGEQNRAVREMRRTLEEAATCTEDFDDLFIIHSRAASVFELASMEAEGIAHRAAAERSLDAFLGFQRELQQSIAPMIERIMQLEKERSPA